MSVVQISRAKATAREIKRLGKRASRGPWTIYAAPGCGSVGRLIVALGRSVGGSITRSRVRRIARDVFERSQTAQGPTDILLVARSNAEKEPRRKTRTTLQELMGLALENAKTCQPPQETTRA